MILAQLQTPDLADSPLGFGGHFEAKGHRTARRFYEAFAALHFGRFWQILLQKSVAGFCEQ
ncbi:MAG TPA: hypothetical protein VIJ04_24325 [Xanthobacteraceae bacterium]